MKVLYHGWLRGNFPCLRRCKNHMAGNLLVIAATAAEKDKADKYFPNATFVDLEDLKFGKCNYLNLKKNSNRSK